MSNSDKPLVWLQHEIKTPPFSASARIDAGYLFAEATEGGEAITAAFASNAIYWSQMS